MKIRIISLFLSLAFLSIITFEYISNTILVENSSTETVEYVLEKRISDKFIDDDYLVSSVIQPLQIKIKTPHTFKEIFYTFKISSTHFRPPITL